MKRLSNTILVFESLDKTIRVVLSFTYHQGQYIKTFPLHFSQTIIKDNKEEDEVVVKLYSSVTDHLIMELLVQGKDLEVKAPASLRKLMKKNLTRSLYYYG